MDQGLPSCYLLRLFLKVINAHISYAYWYKYYLNGHNQCRYHSYNEPLSLLGGEWKKPIVSDLAILHPIAGICN